jgi:hypothetical protein
LRRNDSEVDDGPKKVDHTVRRRYAAIPIRRRIHTHDRGSEEEDTYT